MSGRAAQLVVIVAILVAMGMVALFSASAVIAEGHARFGDSYHFLKKQLLWTAIAVLGLLVTSMVPTSFWMKVRLPILLLAAGLLCLVFVPGFGATINGARRWLKAGGYFVQPSEFAKLALAIFLCGYAAADPQRLRTFWRGFVPLFAATGLICALVVVEPDVGTAAFLGFTAVVTMLVAGVRMGHLLPAGAMATVAAGGLVLAKFEHFRDRFLGWWHGDSYQLQQSLIALGSGGWLGEGLGRGSQKLYFLPEVHSDFILSIVGEEMGFAGTIAVLLLFAALGFVGWRIARHATTPFASLLAFVLTFDIILQAAINVAVVTGLVPTKGIPLPFFSFGGSSLCFTMACVGILIRIADERGETCDSSWPAAVPAAISSRA